eukprot:3065544-Rhodomonas_salina.1
MSDVRTGHRLANALQDGKEGRLLLVCCEAREMTPLKPSSTRLSSPSITLRAATASREDRDSLIPSKLTVVPSC